MSFSLKNYLNSDTFNIDLPEPDEEPIREDLDDEIDE